MTGVLSFVVSSFWTGLLGYLSWMWAFTLSALTGAGLWVLEGSLVLILVAAAVGWLAGALREAWVIQGKMKPHLHR